MSRLLRISYQIWIVAPLYKLLINDISELKQRSIEAWSAKRQSVIDIPIVAHMFSFRRRTTLCSDAHWPNLLKTTVNNYILKMTMWSHGQERERESENETDDPDSKVGLWHCEIAACWLVCCDHRTQKLHHCIHKYHCFSDVWLITLPQQFSSVQKVLVSETWIAMYWSWKLTGGDHNICHQGQDFSLELPLSGRMLYTLTI